MALAATLPVPEIPPHPGPRACTPGGPRWTPAEDALLRARFPKQRAALCRALPHRSWNAICKRAATHGLCVKPGAWRPAEDAVLDRLWGAVALRTLCAKLPGRTPGAVCVRAQTLGLPARAQGLTSLSALARRECVALDVLRRTLHAAGVSVRCIEGSTRGARAHYPKRYVDADDARAALRAHFAAHDALVTITAAARAAGVYRKTLRAWLTTAGVYVPGARGRAAYYPRAVVARVLAAHGRPEAPCSSR